MTVYAEIKKYIEEHGWIKYESVNKDGEVCLTGAMTGLNLCTCSDSISSQHCTYYEVDRNILSIFADKHQEHCVHYNVTSFNDCVHTTLDEVYAVLTELDSREAN